MPIATAFASSPPMPTAAAIAAMVALISELSVAVTVTAPTLWVASPSVEPEMSAVTVASTKFAASAPPPATAVLFELLAAAAIATAAEIAWIVALSDAVTETAAPPVVSEVTFWIEAVTGSVIEFRANETPMPTEVALSEENPAATEAATTVASMIEVSLAETDIPAEAMEWDPPPSTVAPMSSETLLKANAPAPVTPVAELLEPEIATAAATTVAWMFSFEVAATVTAPVLSVELAIEAVTAPEPVSVPSPIRLCASEAPMPTAVAPSLENDAAAEAATTVAVMPDVSVAVTLSAPVGDPDTPICVPETVAVVSAPIRLSASEAPPATETESLLLALIASEAATDVAVMLSSSVAETVIGEPAASTVPALVKLAATLSWMVLRAMPMPIAIVSDLPLPEKLPDTAAAPSSEVIVAASDAVTLSAL